MNLFYLDDDLDKCAEAHIDKHVGKMQLEITQMLCTNTWIDECLGYLPRKITPQELAEVQEYIHFSSAGWYKPTHTNHPCTIWLRTTFENFEYGVLLVDALNRESKWRGYAFEKSHALAMALPAPKHIKSDHFTTPALAMPDEYKTESPVESYRNYYRNDKAGIASWKIRGAPGWWSETANTDTDDSPPWIVS